MYEAHAVIYHKRFYNIYLDKHPSQYTKDTPEHYIDKKYRAFDEWLAHVVQEKYLCYVSSKMLVSQKNDFSIIENRFIKRHSRSVYKFYFYKHGL